MMKLLATFIMSFVLVSSGWACGDVCPMTPSSAEISANDMPCHGEKAVQNSCDVAMSKQDCYGVDLTSISKIMVDDTKIHVKFEKPVVDASTLNELYIVADEFSRAPPVALSAVSAKPSIFVITQHYLI